MMANNLSEDEFWDIKEAFSLFDINSIGQIMTRELGTWFRSLGINPSEEELQEMINEANAQESKVITFDQFLFFFFEEKRKIWFWRRIKGSI